jgi:hypothetical protein
MYDLQLNIYIYIYIYQLKLNLVSSDLLKREVSSLVLYIFMFFLVADISIEDTLGSFNNG